MSRIGKIPIGVPADVKVSIDAHIVTVTGKKGKLSRTFRPEISIEISNGLLIVIPKVESKKVYAYWGMSRSLLNNMVIGVSDGFTKKLLIEGVGYRASVDKTGLTLNVGFSNPVVFQLPPNVSAEVDKNNTITLSAIDKELLGLTAAKIREIRKPEPYKGKGIRYENEYIARKAGKSGAGK